MRNRAARNGDEAHLHALALDDRALGGRIALAHLDPGELGHVEDEPAFACLGRALVPRRAHESSDYLVSTACVCIVSDSSFPDSSVTRVCHTMVLLPLCSGVASARIVPPFPAAKKLVFDSIVAVAAPSGRLRIVAVPPTASASAISVPPCTVPRMVHRRGWISSSATTRSVPVSTKRMPRCSASRPFHMLLTSDGFMASRWNRDSGINVYESPPPFIFGRGVVAIRRQPATGHDS